jgi:hypothetical protein
MSEIPPGEGVMGVTLRATRIGRPPDDLSGQRFVHLVAIRHAGTTPKGIIWHCRCDCGQTRDCLASELKRGGIISCGCTRRPRPVKHGHYAGGRTSRTAESYHRMMMRCYNPNDDKHWDLYGGRGITVCERWRQPDGAGFLAFLADMGERPEGRSLDRIDTNGNYEPENCRWATQVEQIQNRRPFKEWRKS